jgi:hypothetical protein
MVISVIIGLFVTACVWLVNELRNAPIMDE